MILGGFIKKLLYRLVIPAVTIFAAFYYSPQNDYKPYSLSPEIQKNNDSVFIPGPQSQNGSIGFRESVRDIMERNKYLKLKDILGEDLEEEKIIRPDRTHLIQNPQSKDEPFYPPSNRKHIENNTNDNPQTIGTSFTAATLAGTNPTGSYPADNMGAVGPTQYIVAVNGRIVSYDKTTGTADGVINTDEDNFFNSVRNGYGTSDPRIRYDRLSQKWFVIIINVPVSFNNNRILIAVSNTSTITLSTVWTFFFINIATFSPPISTSCLADYPTLGIDNSALYIGTNNFCPGYNSTDGFVINKANLIAGSLTATVFRGLVPTSGSEGPYTPQGVDNFDVSSTEGYFIGVSNIFWGELVVRRVSNPGTSPSISSNILLPVSSTFAPLTVNHLGNTGVSGYRGRLDALDDRLFAAVIRNGRLWTAHNIGVDNTGSVAAPNRNAIRWYELQNMTSTPSVVQSGTVFNSSNPNDSNQLNYWIPTIMVSGQGHAGIIFSSAGTNARINTATCGRLSGNTLGTMQSVSTITSSSNAYNPGDLGISRPRRWGDYSYVSLDPNDDMTMWGVMGFCDNLNSYGVRVTKLIAPPPPPLTNANPNNLNPGQPSVNIIITGTPVSGEGFFDPGSGFTNRIAATISSGVVVNSITYNSPTQVTLNVNTVSSTPGLKNVIITNPDGQSVSNSVIFEIIAPVNISSFNYSVDKRNVTLKWVTVTELNNKGFDIERMKIGGQWEKSGYVEGHGTSNQQHEYIYKDLKLETGKYNYRLKQIDYNGTYERFYMQGVVSVGIPVSADLFQNYPNPFNPLTKIDFNLPDDGIVSLKVYDIIGKEMVSIVSDFKKAGYYTVEFDASRMASGVYFYKLITGNFTRVKKMLVVK